MSIKQQIIELLDHAEDLKSSGHYLDAILTSEKILVLDLNCVEAYEEIGDNYLSLQEFSRAEKALRRALELDPESANANYLLGFLFSARRDFRASVTFLEKADAGKTNHPEVLRCLGWSFYNLGERARGIILLERARALSPNDIYVLTDLGVCHLNDHNVQPALNIFRRILELDPSNEKARECLAIVEQYTTRIRK